MFFLSGILTRGASLAVVHHHGFNYHFGWTIQPLLALVAGVLILIRPKLLNFIVAIYLILVGVMGLFNLSLG